MNYNFNSHKNKIQARQESIIEVYEKFFNRKYIPHNKCYISMCAEQVAGDKLQEGSELKQLLDKKFITINQFYGIDINEEIIIKNSVVKEANWINQDIYTFILKNIEKIDPAIVNLDTVYANKAKMSNLVSNVLYHLSVCSIKNCLVIGNVVVNNPYSSGTVDRNYEETELLNYQSNLVSNQYYIESKKYGWKQHHMCYRYRSRVAMMRSYFYYIKD